MAPAGSSFARARTVRVVSGIASAGVVAGISLVAASPAAAAAPDCTGVTVDASTQNGSDIQDLLTSNEPIVCLIGTFNLTSGLVYSSNLTLYGLSDAALVGNDSFGLLTDNDLTLNRTLNVENIAFSRGANIVGGAIWGSTVTATNSRFTDNAAQGGGAIGGYNVEVVNSTFEDNEAGWGGAIVAIPSEPDASDSSIVATDSTFTTNTAEEGGAIYSYGVLELYSSTFDSNTAQRNGGAVVSEYGAYIENSTFVGNRAGLSGGTDPGGALSLAYGVAILQSTFLDNSADPGPGQTIAFGFLGELFLVGNIFAGTSTDAHLFTGSPTIYDDGGNVFSTSEATETGLSSVEPSTQFNKSKALIFNGAALASNGGVTQTVALYAGSPAVGAVTTGSLTVDQRGVTRPASADAGAYEFVPPTLANTGSAPSGLLGGAAALLLAGGALVLGLARRTTRTR